MTESLLEADLDLILKSGLFQLKQHLRSKPKIEIVAQQKVKEAFSLDELTFDVLFNTNGMERNSSSTMELLCSHLLLRNENESPKQSQRDSQFTELCSENLFSIFLKSS